MKTRTLMIIDPLDFELKGLHAISGDEIEIDEEANSSSTIKLATVNTNGNEIDYNVKELDFIVIKEDNNIIYQGVAKMVTDDEGYFKIVVKDIINIFDEKIEVWGDGTLQKTTGVEDFIAACISQNWTVGTYAQNGIQPKVLTHTKINASVSNENGIFNLATYMNNVKILYDIAIDFEFKFNEDTSIELYVNLYKKEESKKIIDLNALNKNDINEVYNSTVLASVTAISKNRDRMQYVLLNDRTICDWNDADLNKVVFGKKTTIYVEDWSTAKQEILNQFKANNYEHYFEFNCLDNYDIGEKVILITTRNEQIETYISGKKYLDTGYTYKTGKLRVKFLDKFLKEKRG